MVGTTTPPEDRSLAGIVTVALTQVPTLPWAESQNRGRVKHSPCTRRDSPASAGSDTQATRAVPEPQLGEEAAGPDSSAAAARRRVLAAKAIMREPLIMEGATVTAAAAAAAVAVAVVLLLLLLLTLLLLLLLLL